MPKNNTSFNVSVETGQEVYGEILTLLRGYSPYELALKDGFVGTEEEWLASLVGEKGETGNGIENVVMNDDYTLTIFYTNGEQYTTPDPIRGEKGETGNGIESATMNPDYTLTLLFTNGGSFTTIPIRGLQGERGLQGVQGERGETGNSISRVKLNSDYTLTISFTDGTSQTTSPIRGAQGEQGEPGVGIEYATMNSDYTLTIKYTDGNEYKTPPLRGVQGIQGVKGDTGTGIDSAVLNPDYTLTLNFTDGTSYTTTSIRGQAGIQGEQGIQGETGNGIAKTILNSDYTLTLSFTDGSSYTTPSIRGMQGIQGIQGVKGTDGVGISSTILNPDYTLTLRFTDGTHYTTSSIRGAEGSKGDKGDAGNGIDHVVLNSNYTLTFYFDDGTQYTTTSIRGEKGEKGDDGDTPTITTSKEGKTTTIYVDDVAVGTIDDGEDGTTPAITATKVGTITTIFVDGASIATINDGTNGTNGADGFSPTATVSKTGGIATLTIIDKNGTTTTQIYDGANVTASDPNDDGHIVVENTGDGNIDPTPTEDSPNAVSSGGVYDELSDLKGSLSELDYAVDSMQNTCAKVSSSDASNVDLDIADQQGNVIMRLKGGHIKTKEFDSSELNIDVDDTLSQEGKPADAKATGDAIFEAATAASALVQVLPTEETEADLYICDANGNVIALFVDGEIVTKNFNSAILSDGIPYVYMKYEKSISYVAGTDKTVEVSGDWKAGDRIVFHIDDGMNGHANKPVYYYAGTTSLQEYTTIAYAGAYYEVVLPINANVLKVILGGSLWSEDKTLTWEIYKIGTIPIIPKIITVQASGGCDFTSIRAAIDSIEKPSSVVNPYIIEVYKGTYNTIGYFTDEEIATATSGEADACVGLLLPDGISLRGMGTTPDEVVLTATMDTTKWSADIRGQISTLNREGTNFIENITVIGENIRYCVHDDMWSGNGDRHKAHVKNCIFIDDGLVTNRTYGMGSKSGQSIIFENCDFGTTGTTYHTNHGGRYPCKASFVKCRGHELNITDYGLTATGMKNELVINDCAFDYIAVAENYNENGLKIVGTNSWNAMIWVPYGHVYNLGNVARFTASSWLTAGKVVSMNGSSLDIGTYSNYYGVCVGSDSDYAYILKFGYLCSLLVGLTGLSVGDYVTVSNGSIVSGGTQSNAIGVVKRVNTSGDAFIKLF